MAGSRDVEILVAKNISVLYEKSHCQYEKLDQVAEGARQCVTEVESAFLRQCEQTLTVKDVLVGGSLAHRTFAAGQSDIDLGVIFGCSRGHDWGKIYDQDGPVWKWASLVSSRIYTRLGATLESFSAGTHSFKIVLVAKHTGLLADAVGSGNKLAIDIVPRVGGNVVRRRMGIEGSSTARWSELFFRSLRAALGPAKFRTTCAIIVALKRYGAASPLKLPSYLLELAVCVCVLPMAETLPDGSFTAADINFCKSGHFSARVQLPSALPPH